MVRISASNEQEISALLSYFKPAVRKGFLIADTNRDDKYSSNVGQEFLSELGIANLVADQTYSTAPGQFNPSRISDAAQSICSDHPDAVLFGGRGRDLGTLVGDLATGTCLKDHITILTGNNAIAIDYAHNSDIPAGLKRNVSVIYAGAFSPAAWQKPIDIPVAGKDEFAQAAQGYRAYAAALEPVAAVNTDNNANVALSYDAMLTAVAVIRQAYKGPGLTPGGLLSYLTAFQADNPIYGASGPIVLSGIYDGSSKQGSNPVGKMIPILKFNPDGTSTFLGLEQATVISPGS
jgi:hypothetical protein